MKANRNEPCPCGSGLKSKHCCQGKAPWYKPSRWSGLMIIALILAGLVLVGLSLMNDDNGGRGAAPPGQVWSEEHGHYHDIQ